MNKPPTFKNIENYSVAVEENEFFTQYTNIETPDRYDSNYVSLKFSPNLQEFKLIEKMHLEYQETIQQKHLKFVWPEKTGLQLDLLDYLDQKDYKIGMQNLYWITPEHFNGTEINQELSIQVVTDQNLEDFLKINLEEDHQHGSKFLKHRKKIYPYLFKQAHTSFVLAYLNNEPVGSLILVSSKDFLEVDNVLTDYEFRGNKVATTMLNDVINKRANKEQAIILVADAEDTPKEMYENLGFQCISYQISAQKEL